jgi:hypothetical protein
MALRIVVSPARRNSPCRRCAPPRNATRSSPSTRSPIAPPAAGARCTPSPVKREALQRGIPVLQPEFAETAARATPCARCSPT